MKPSIIGYCWGGDVEELKQYEAVLLTVPAFPVPVLQSELQPIDSRPFVFNVSSLLYFFSLVQASLMLSLSSLNCSSLSALSDSDIIDSIDETLDKGEEKGNYTYFILKFKLLNWNIHFIFKRKYCNRIKMCPE